MYCFRWTPKTCLRWFWNRFTLKEISKCFWDSFIIIWIFLLHCNIVSRLLGLLNTQEMVLSQYFTGCKTEHEPEGLILKWSVFTSWKYSLKCSHFSKYKLFNSQILAINYLRKSYLQATKAPRSQNASR